MSRLLSILLFFCVLIVNSNAAELKVDHVSYPEYSKGELRRGVNQIKSVNSKSKNTALFKHAFTNLFLTPLEQNRMWLFAGVMTLIAISTLKRKRVPLATNINPHQEKNRTEWSRDDYIERQPMLSKFQKQRMLAKAKQVFVEYHQALASKRWNTLEDLCTKKQLSDLKQYGDHDHHAALVDIDADELDAKLLLSESVDEMMSVRIRFHAFIEANDDPTIEYIDTWDMLYDKHTNSLLVAAVLF